MENKEMKLESLRFIKINFYDKEHLEFLKKLFENSEDSSMDFLGDLSNCKDNNAFIVCDEEIGKIGYFSMTDPVVNSAGMVASGAYYAILHEYRKKGYASKLLKEISDYVLNDIDMLVLSINKANIASRKVAERNQFEIIFEDDEDMLFAKYAKTKVINK